MKKNMKGITLVALVVTIIVLLILAGIAINLSIGNNGLFSRARNVTNAWKKAEANETEEMKNFENIYDNVLEGINNKERKKEFYIELYENATYSNLIEKLSFEFEEGMSFDDWTNSKYCVGLEEMSVDEVFPGGWQVKSYKFLFNGEPYNIEIILMDDFGFTGEEIIKEGKTFKAFK